MCGEPIAPFLLAIGVILAEALHLKTGIQCQQGVADAACLVDLPAGREARRLAVYLALSAYERRPQAMALS